MVADTFTIALFKANSNVFLKILQGSSKPYVLRGRNDNWVPKWLVFQLNLLIIFSVDLLPVLAYYEIRTCHTTAMHETTLLPKIGVRDEGFANENVRNLSEYTLETLLMILRRRV